jgi:thiol-disulfide isomerase/thioredoxin
MTSMILNIISTFIILFATPDIVVHFFYSPDCGHCMDMLIGDIPNLQKKYRFQLKKYDLSSLENYKILEKMEKGVKNKGEDLPIILSRHKSIFKDTIKQELDTTIIKIGVINLYYFYQSDCKECGRIEKLLRGLQENYTKLKVHNYNIFNDSNKIFYENLAEKMRIPQKKRLLVPAIFIGENYLIKEDITSTRIEELFQKYRKGSPKLDTLSFKLGEESIRQRFSKFSTFGILSAGLLDGVNPCAFATLVFFVSYLMFIGRHRRDIILMAISFIAAVFITYFSIGIGAYNLLKYLTGFAIVSKLIFFSFGIIAIIPGILSMRDYFIARKKRV